MLWINLSSITTSFKGDLLRLSHTHAQRPKAQRTRKETQTNKQNLFIFVEVYTRKRHLLKMKRLTCTQCNVHKCCYTGCNLLLVFLLGSFAYTHTHTHTHTHIYTHTHTHFNMPFSATSFFHLSQLVIFSKFSASTFSSGSWSPSSLPFAIIIPRSKKRWQS